MLVGPILSILSRQVLQAPWDSSGCKRDYIRWMNGRLQVGAQGSRFGQYWKSTCLAWLRYCKEQWRVLSGFLAYPARNYQLAAEFRVTSASVISFLPNTLVS